VTISKDARPIPARWRGLAFLVGTAAALRFACLLLLRRAPGFEWVDPDHYAGFARMF
jgi:hypothetical protein